MKTNSNFLNTIHQLRAEENIVFCTDKNKVSNEEEEDVISYLELEYEQESLNYPFSPPVYNGKAAIWAAKYVYLCAHFSLFRIEKIENVSKLLVPYQGEIDVAAILSADLTLRFLPYIYKHIKEIDSSDAILPKIEETMKRFYYSSIGANVDLDFFNLEMLFKNDCFKQLFLNRIIAHKSYKSATNKMVMQGLFEIFGTHKDNFWKELIIENNEGN